MFETLVRWINIIVWAVVMAYMAKAAYSTLLLNAERRSDPIRFGFFLVAGLIVTFNIKGIFWHDHLQATSTLLTASIGIGSYIVWVARSYGRGPYV